MFMETRVASSTPFLHILGKLRVSTIPPHEAFGLNWLLDESIVPPDGWLNVVWMLLGTVGCRWTLLGAVRQCHVLFGRC